MVDSLVNDREKALKSLQLATLSHEVPAAGKNTTSFEKSRGIISSEIALQNVMTKQVDAEIAYVSEIKGILTPEQTKQWVSICFIIFLLLVNYAICICIFSCYWVLQCIDHGGIEVFPFLWIVVSTKFTGYL